VVLLQEILNNDARIEKFISVLKEVNMDAIISSVFGAIIGDK